MSTAQTPYRASAPALSQFPDVRTFCNLAQEAVAQGKQLVPIYRRLLSDALTPVLAYRRLVRPDPRMAPSFLLESVEGGQRVGRFSFLGAQPVAQLIARGNEVRFEHARQAELNHVYQCEDPLRELARLSANWSLLRLAELPTFTGGWVGYAGYDAVRYAEPEKLGQSPPDDRGLPDVHMQLYESTAVFDHARKTLLLVTHVAPHEHGSLEAAYQQGTQRLDELVERLQKPASDGVELPVGPIETRGATPTLPISRMGLGGYQRAVEEAKQYIAAGDAFQVVPSQRFELTTQADPFDVYRALRVINPSPYMFYLQVQGAMLVGSSPEILCKVEDGLVTNRPLAGTRRRGSSEAEDEDLAADLRSDPKEVAEHVMLVDLARNDVGVVAQPGSVRVPAKLVVERYSHVMHLSSTVTGRLREGLTCWDALRAALPVGTVSGAPKVRAMQIIDELEPVKRGPYAGAVGYADFSGDMDMAIALRTMVILPTDDPARWSVHLQAGGGIVADSEPEAEHQETLNKAAAMAKAVQAAEAMLPSVVPPDGNAAQAGPAPTPDEASQGGEGQGAR